MGKSSGQFLKTMTNISRFSTQVSVQEGLQTHWQSRIYAHTQSLNQECQEKVVRGSARGEEISIDILSHQQSHLSLSASDPEVVPHVVGEVLLVDLGVEAPA